MSDSGMIFRSAKGTAELNWDAFPRYAETKNLFMLYVQSRLFHVIPKRAFTPEDLLAFREMLQMRLGAKSASYEKRLSPRLVALLAAVVVVAILLAVVLVRARG